MGLSDVRVINRITLAALLLALPAVSAAQSQVYNTTRERIEKAKQYYEAFNVEQARPLLLEILSSNYLLPVTTAERVEAYKYLGASYAVIGRRDEAIQYFVAAITFDPFTDLNQSAFSPAELAAFAQARLQIFKVGLRPLTARVIDPTSQKAESSYTVRLVTTQNATITVDLVKQNDPTQQVTLYNGPADGVREFKWGGLLQSATVPSPGLYNLRVSGTSLRAQQKAEAIQTVDIQHFIQPLEDTIPELKAMPAYKGDTLFLRDRYNPNDPWADAAKGAFLTVAAAGLAYTLERNDLDAWKRHTATISLVGVSSAVGMFLYRRSHLKISRAETENVRRDDRRRRFNDGVIARNRDRMAKTTLIVRPIAVGG